MSGEQCELCSASCDYPSCPATGPEAHVMLPAMRCGLPTHWLSPESVESLRRWCDDEGVPLSKLRAVVGKAVHVSGPQLAGSEGHGQPINPYNLPAGETYHIVHAEMQLQHHWVAE